MIAKTLTYQDFDGNEITETFYFNLSKAELMEMQVSVDGGLDQLIKKVSEEKDPAKLLNLFKMFVLKSFGIKSDDGKRFIKNDAYTEAFTQTNAYSDLYMSLLSDTNAAIDFITGIVPDMPELDQKIAEIKAQNNL